MYLERENKSTAYSTRKRGTVRCIVHVGVLGWVLPSQAMCCELPRPQAPVIGKLATREGNILFATLPLYIHPLYLPCTWNVESNPMKLPPRKRGCHGHLQVMGLDHSQDTPIFHLKHPLVFL